MKSNWKTLLGRIQYRSGSEITASSKPLSSRVGEEELVVRNVGRHLPLKDFWNIPSPSGSFLHCLTIESLSTTGPQSVDWLLSQGLSKRDGISSWTELPDEVKSEGKGPSSSPSALTLTSDPAKVIELLMFMAEED